MSRDTKRTWSEQVEEIDNDKGKLSVKMDPNSRETSSSRKKSKPNNDKPIKPKKPLELETDPAVLQRRQKQIDYGKNTVGYANYTRLIPQDQRTPEHPKTPDKYAKYSRRAWDMLIKIWRKNLHEFDEENKDGKNKKENEADDIEISHGNKEENEGDADDIEIPYGNKEENKGVDIVISYSDDDLQ